MTDMITEKVWKEMRAVGLPSAEDLDRFIAQQQELDRAREATRAQISRERA
jgi:hypothetical protein